MPPDGVAALGHLEQVAGGEEPGVGHQPLVHRTQLVDAQLRIGDVASRVALLLAGGQHQLGQHLLERLVAQLHLVEVAGGAGVEEQGIQPGELEVELVGGLGIGLVEGPLAGKQLLLGGFGVVALVHQLEEPGERLVEVGAVAGRLGVEVHLAQLAQPVEAVALGVGLVVGGHDAQLGAGLGVEQHQQPVEVAQALACQLVGVDARLGVEVCPPSGAALGDHLVGEDLDAVADALAQRLGHADGVLVGLVDQLVERALGAVAVGSAREERVGREQGGDRLELTLGFGVVAFQGGVEVDRQVTALGPLGPLGQQHDSPAQHQHEPGRFVDGEQLADRVRRCGDVLLVAVTLAFMEEAPCCWSVVCRRVAAGWAVVEQVVGRVGQTCVECDEPQAGARLCGCRCRDRELVGGVARELEVVAVGLQAQRFEHHVVEVLDRRRCPVAGGLAGGRPRLEEPTGSALQRGPRRRLTLALRLVPRLAEITEVAADDRVQIVVGEELTPVGDRRKRHPRPLPRRVRPHGAAAPHAAATFDMSGAGTGINPFCRVRFSEALWRSADGAAAPPGAARPGDRAPETATHFQGLHRSVS